MSRIIGSCYFNICVIFVQSFTLSPVHTGDYEYGDCRRKRRLSPNSATTNSENSATIVASVDMA